MFSEKSRNLVLSLKNIFLGIKKPQHIPANRALAPLNKEVQKARDAFWQALGQVTEIQSQPHRWLIMRHQTSISIFLVLIWAHCADYYILVVMQLISLPVFLKHRQRPDVFLFCCSELWAQTARPLPSESEACHIRHASHETVKHYCFYTL